MDEQFIRIKFKAFSHKVLDLSAQKIVDAVRDTGVMVKGPIPLPRRIKKFTVLRGPHIDKKSREQFEMIVHFRIVDIVNPTLQTVNALMKLDLPAGVSVEVKL